MLLSQSCSIQKHTVEIADADVAWVYGSYQIVSTTKKNGSTSIAERLIYDMVFKLAFSSYTLQYQENDSTMLFSVLADSSESKVSEVNTDSTTITIADDAIQW
jgi:hypothetical protein